MWWIKKLITLSIKSYVALTKLFALDIVNFFKDSFFLSLNFFEDSFFLLSAFLLSLC